MRLPHRCCLLMKCTLFNSNHKNARKVDEEQDDGENLHCDHVLFRNDRGTHAYTHTIKPQPTVRQTNK